MDLFALPPVAAVFDAAYGALMGLAGLLEPLAGSAAAAAAVVLVTLVVRALLIPVGIAQARAEQARARIAPKVATLQRRHAKDPERLQRELMRLYAEERTSPFAGCLPMLAQAPVVGLIYALFLHPSVNGHPNELLGHELLGVPLGSSLAGSIANGTVTPEVILVFGAVVVLIAAVGELTRRVLRPVPAGPDSGPGAPASAAASPAPRLVRMLGLLQFLTAAIAVFVPLAAGLYLLVTVVWTLGQRVVLRRRYPLSPAAGGAGREPLSA